MYKTPYPYLETVLEDLSETSKQVPVALPATVLGTIVAFSASTGPMVTFPGNPVQAPVTAQSTVPLQESHIGRRVTLLFEGAKPDKPIISGILMDFLADPRVDHSSVQPKRMVAVRSEGERLVLKADQEIVLECGKASITLTKAGKVLIKGEYVLSRSAGANKIKGGSVQIN